MFRAGLFLLFLGVGCAPATPASTSGGTAGRLDEACPIEPERFALFEEGEVPLVITSTHAGSASPMGCDLGSDVLRPLAPRVCDDALESCASGPCRAGAGDRNARLLTFAVVDELERCLGGRPSLALTETTRLLVDMNRDAYDEMGGLRCAMNDEAALPYWEAFHRGVEELVASAAALAEARGGRALLVDVHTYNSLAAAPPPAVLLGSGVPFGTTLPALVAEDPTLSRVFGSGGLRARLLANLAAITKGAPAVHPSSLDAPLAGLFNGRYMVHRYARMLDPTDPRPVIDALQIEVSSGLRDDTSGSARAIAEAVCASFGDLIAATRAP